MNRKAFAPALLVTLVLGTSACDQSPSGLQTELAPQFAVVKSTSFSESFDRGSASPSGKLEVSGFAPTYANGAIVFAGTYDAERGYMRTAGADYNALNFRADVTVTVAGTSGGSGIAFIGFGNGDANHWHWYEPSAGAAVYARILPDDFWGPAIQLTDAATWSGELEKIDGVGGNGTHRVRITWNRATGLFTFAIHPHYVAGQDFAPTASTSVQIDPSVFTSGNSRIFFGGAGDVSFDDLHITAAPGNLGM